jgi:fatty-acyl-CoA synthase
MTHSSHPPLRTLADIVRYEQEMPLAERMPARRILDLFVASAAKFPDRLALTQVMTGEPDEQPRRITHRDFAGQIHQAANLFHALAGPRPGVAYLLPSLIETYVTLWGAETAGFAVPINYLLNPDYIADLIKASGAAILVTLGPSRHFDIWQKALGVKALLPNLHLVQILLPGEAAGEGALEFGAALADQPATHLNFTDAGQDDDVAAYFHTGGTTGAPKLVAHSHRNQIAAAFGSTVMMQMAETDVILNGFPLFHVAGTIYNGLACSMSGGEIVILSPAGFRTPAMVRRYWQLVERYRAVRIGGVPTILGALCDVPLDGADLSSVRNGVCGAASTPAAVALRFEQHSGKPLHEILGMTETAGLTCIDPGPGTRTIGSVGFRLPYTQVVIRKLEAGGALGEPCGPDEIGVLTVSGPTVSRGYLNQEQNKGVFVDGLLNSGDLAYADADGRVHIAGRAKDLIIRGGHNIDPLMIEAAMSAHPDVAMAAAVSQPDTYAGELPVCYVALRPGASITEAELQAHAHAAIVERPAWPKHIYIIPAIPVTDVGKIFKPQLRADATVRLVQKTLEEKLATTEAIVQASEGGKHGMRVQVSLPAHLAHLAQDAAMALSGYVFESHIEIAKQSD